jgi:hypothetical protein
MCVVSKGEYRRPLRTSNVYCQCCDKVLCLSEERNCFLELIPNTVSKLRIGMYLCQSSLGRSVPVRTVIPELRYLGLVIYYE